MENLEASLLERGLPLKVIQKIKTVLADHQKALIPERLFQKIIKDFPALPFEAVLVLYKFIYPHWETEPGPAWLPDESAYKNTNIAALMLEKGFKNPAAHYPDFHRWSHQSYPEFWRKMASLLYLHFDTPYHDIVDLSQGLEKPAWFPGATLNIANSCFQADRKSLALISQTEQGKYLTMTTEELDFFSNRIANSLQPFAQKGARVAIIMPMTLEAVALYLGLIKAGMVVCAIPDSFSSAEIKTRLEIAEVSLIFCQDQSLRAGKLLALYEKITVATKVPIIVLPISHDLTVQCRKQDCSFAAFLSEQPEHRYFEAVSCTPEEMITILFSSGTSGTPKALPWTHTTPLKCASDAYLHHNLKANDRFCWPSNLGWMMGPWLIFACLLNKATLVLYPGAPNGRAFGQFLEKAKITHLGVVPTLVRNWRATACMEGLHWKELKLFTSTGERSNLEDMLYLMSLAAYKPIIEYCGGTEIGGAYLSGTLLHPAAPTAFTSKALGLDFLILNEQQQPAQQGEVALIPPSIGLSTQLLKQDHHQVYYKDMQKFEGIPLLRRHGDFLERTRNGFYRLLGRCDDVMKLSGIKISSAELEQILQQHPAIYEAAAVALDSAQGGPSALVVFAVLRKESTLNKESLKMALQEEIKTHLNPLFKITDLVLVKALPRTASNKILRRVLRDSYHL